MNLAENTSNFRLHPEDETHCTEYN